MHLYNKICYCILEADKSVTLWIILTNEISGKMTNRLASSSLRFASISLLGGYLGRLDGSHAKGSAVKNCTHRKLTEGINTQHQKTCYKNQMCDKDGNLGAIMLSYQALETPTISASLDSCSIMLFLELTI